MFQAGPSGFRAHTSDTTRYSVLSVIGRGAGSTIYRARADKDGSLVAVKVVRREADPEGRFGEQVEQEYQAGRAVSHDHVRQYLELQRDRRWFRIVQRRLVMEYLDGNTLEQGFEQGTAAAVPRLVEVFSAVAAGLQAIHEAGYVHADVKPNNIMLCGRRVKLFDLGQSCRMGTVKSRIQGTPDFIAPEQVLKLPLDERTDVFNLGATMYWCLTGKTYPTRLQSKRTAAVFSLSRPSEAPTPQQCNGQTPGVLSNLVMDCCRNGPQHRPRNMGEVLRVLQATAVVLRREQSRTAAGQAPDPDL